MADAATAVKTQDAGLNIPLETAEKFADLVPLIKASKSMNDEERQYWVDVLPIMSQDQIKNLRGILDNEQKQIQKTTGEYNKGMREAEAEATKAFDEAAYMEKKRMRVEEEARHEAEEKEHEENILKELENL